MMYDVTGTWAGQKSTLSTFEGYQSESGVTKGDGIGVVSIDGGAIWMEGVMEVLVQELGVCGNCVCVCVLKVGATEQTYGSSMEMVCSPSMASVARKSAALRATDSE